VWNKNEANMMRKLRSNWLYSGRGKSSSAPQRLSFEQLEDRQMLAAFDLLVFSKTVEFRHSSIEPGIAAIQQLGEANDFTVAATEDAAMFAADNLANYEAVVFLHWR
jgi:hypothetical protein